MQYAESPPESVSANRELTVQGGATSRGVRVSSERAIAVACVRHRGRACARQTVELLAAQVAPFAACAPIAGMGPNDPLAPVAPQASGGTEDTPLAGHQPFPGRLATLLAAGREEPPVSNSFPERARSERRFARLRGGRTEYALRGRTAIVVNDGVAVGFAARASGVGPPRSRCLR